MKASFVKKTHEYTLSSIRIVLRVFPSFSNPKKLLFLFAPHSPKIAKFRAVNMQKSNVFAIKTSISNCLPFKMLVFSNTYKIAFIHTLLISMTRVEPQQA